MIIVQLTGGLGNQMFQYALGRSLSITQQCTLKLDLSWYREYDKIEDTNDPNKATRREYLLKYFNISGRILPSWYLNAIRKISLIRKYHPKVARIIPNQLFDYNVLVENDFSWTNIKNQTYYFATGYWQQSLYFEKYQDVIDNDFRLKNPLSIINQKYYQQILSTNSVAIHIRRGDLISKPSGSELQPTCTLEYFYSGITTISKKVKDLSLFIFSDDMEWCKNHFKNQYPIIFVDSVGQDHEHFYLMTQCKYQVIANSTYSWWAAWLNQYPDKIIIAPKNWYHDAQLNESAIFVPNTWIRITNQGFLHE